VPKNTTLRDTVKLFWQWQVMQTIDNGRLDVDDTEAIDIRRTTGTGAISARATP